MAVAIVALVFAVAGTSLAGVATISKLSKKEKTQTRNIANTEINKAAPNLDVKTARGPQVWAHVSSAGTVLDGRGVSQANVSAGAAGYRCFSGLSPAPKGIQASVDYWNGTPSFPDIAQVGLASSGGLGGTGCAAGTQAFVRGTNANTNVAANIAFYVTFND
jgi:hypothetical protein